MIFEHQNPDQPERAASQDSLRFRRVRALRAETGNERISAHGRGSVRLVRWQDRKKQNLGDGQARRSAGAQRARDSHRMAETRRGSGAPRLLGVSMACSGDAGRSLMLE
jgi:hypothetical protein